MKYVDFIIQTMLILAGGWWTIFPFRNDFFSAVLWTEVFLGSWQFISACISVMARAPYLPRKQQLLIAACIYLAILFIGLSSHLTDTLPASFWLVFLTVPFWSLSVCYYILTCKWLLLKKVTGAGFLPHINF